MSQSKPKTDNTLHTASREEVVEKGQERLQVWERARGMWKDRKRDLIEELNKMRQEWAQRVKALEKLYGTTRR